MRAAGLEVAQGPLRVIDVKVDSPADDEMLIRTAACGVCHSDLTIRSIATPGRSRWSWATRPRAWSRRSVPR